MTVKEYIDQWTEALKSLYSREESKAMLATLLDAFCNLPAYTYYSDPHRLLSDESLVNLLRASDDLLLGRPFQYILGKTLFESCIINVREGVLVPRPETAELVRWARTILEQKTESGSEVDGIAPLSVLDVCTGSGAIAISLAKSFPLAEVYGVDISEEALAIAEENAKANNVRVRFSQADILQPSSSNPSFDLFISNPPYVRSSEKRFMRRNVLEYEPHIALFVPDYDPLLFFRALADWGAALLKHGGVLMVEINEVMGEKITTLLCSKGYSAIEVRSDINGKPRMCCAVKRTAHVQ